jgi:hypothetical protein
VNSSTNHVAFGIFVMEGLVYEVSVAIRRAAIRSLAARVGHLNRKRRIRGLTDEEVSNLISLVRSLEYHKRQAEIRVRSKEG